MRLLTAVTALALLGFGAQERPFRGDYPKDGVYWEPSWREAMSESNNRQSPMMWVFQKDGVEACAALGGAFADRKYIETSRMWVNIIAHPGTAHEVDAEIDKKRTTVCSTYWNIPCSLHAKCDLEIRNMYMDSTGLKLPGETPAILFLDGSCKELGRITGPCKVADLIKTQEGILARYPGFKTPAEPWKAAKVMRKEAEDLLGQGEIQKSIQAYLRIQKSKLEGIRHMADVGLGKIASAGELEFTKAFHLCDPKDKKKMEQCKTLLREIVKKFKPLKPAEKAQDMLDGLKSHGH